MLKFAKRSPKPDEYSLLNRAESLVKNWTYTSENKASTAVQAIPPNVSVNKGKRKLTFEGIFFALLSGAFFSIISVIVKYLEYVNALESTFVRFVGLFVFSSPGIVLSNGNPFGPKTKRMSLILRSLNLFATSGFFFYAVNYLPVADATVIGFASPIVVTIFARIFLKEPCKIVHLVSIFLTIFGLCLVVKLPLLVINGQSALNSIFDTNHIIGVVAGLTSNFTNAAAYIYTRKLKDVHHSVMNMNCGLVSACLAVLFSYGFVLPCCGLDGLLFVLLGLSGYLGHTTLTKALQIEEAGTVSVARSASDIALVYIWQVMFFENPDVLSIVGAILVTSSILLTAIQKWIVSLPADNNTRIKFRILTY